MVPCAESDAMTPSFWNYMERNHSRSSAVYDIKSCIITAEDAKVAKKFL